MHFLGAVIGGNAVEESETIIAPWSEYVEVPNTSCRRATSSSKNVGSVTGWKSNATWRRSKPPNGWR